MTLTMLVGLIYLFEMCINNSSTVVGSFKKYTSRELVKMVQQTHVSRREDYLYSSVKDYAGMKGLSKFHLLNCIPCFTVDSIGNVNRSPRE